MSASSMISSSSASGVVWVKSVLKVEYGCVFDIRVNLDILKIGLNLMNDDGFILNFDKL